MPNSIKINKISFCLKLRKNYFCQMKSHFFIEIFFWIFSLTGFGQSGFFDNNSLQANFHGGKIVKNYPVFPESGMSSFMEFRWQHQSQKQWALYYGFPNVGVAAFFGSFGNPEELGNVFGIMPQMTFTVRRNHQTPIHLILGWGYSYWTKRYDAVTNPDNMAIGANITNMASFSATMPFRLSKNIQMNIGVSTIHCSNGHYRMPNNGINIPSLVLGFRFGNDTIFYKSVIEKMFAKKWQILIQAGMGLHDFGDGSKPIGGPLYPVYTFVSGMTKQINYSGKFHTGIYINYYTGFYDYVVEKQLFGGRQTTYAVTASAYLGYEFILGKFSMAVESGWYIWNPFYKYYKNSLGQNDFKTFLKEYINNKMGFRFYPFAENGNLKGLFFGSYIRANFGQADFSEYAMGFVF